VPLPADAHESAGRLICNGEIAREHDEEAKAAITASVKHYNETRPHSRLAYISAVAWRELQTEITSQASRNCKE
jgi:transposase InsO family protein